MSAGSGRSMGGSYSRPVPGPYRLLQLGQTLLLHPAVSETQGSGFWNRDSGLGLSSLRGIVYRWQRESQGLAWATLRASFLFPADLLFCLFSLQPSCF